MKKDIMLSIANVSLLTVPDRIMEQFSRFKDRIINPNDVRDFEVNTEESKNIAEAKIRTINSLKTEIDNKRKELKEPLNILGKMVQLEAKRYDDDCTLSKSLLNTKVTQFKNLKLAQLKAEEDGKRVKMEEDTKRKEAILKRINNILSNFTSFMFGGDLITSNGESIYVDAPTSIKDLENIKDKVSKSFPSFDVFQEYKSNVIDHYETFISGIESYKIFIEQGNVKAINALKVKYYALCEREIEKTAKVIQKEEKAISKELENEIKSANRGIREMVKFDVVSLPIIPERYKIVDDAKIRDYMTRNKEKIREAIIDGRGEELIPGISFRIERKNVTY